MQKTKKPSRPPVRRHRAAEHEALGQDLEQRVAERTLALKAREHEFRALFDNVPALFSYIDLRQRYRYVNQPYEDLFGISTSQIIGMTVKELLGRDQYKGVRPYLELALSGQAVRFEKELKLSDGKHDFEVRYVPDFAESGEARGCFALLTDVTEQRQREMALRESQDHLQAIVETATEAIITISGKGNIRSFNPAAERMFGFPAVEVIGQNVEILMPPPYREKHNGYLRRYLRTRRPRIIGTTRELPGRRKDGSVFPIELSVSHMDHLDLFTALIRDISERKAAERREREHQTELAHVMRVATAGELASGLAHELNQPLSAISNNIQACVSRIQAGRDTRKSLLGLLKQTSDEALRAGTIVHSIRDMVEKRPPRYERVDLRGPIRKTSTLLGDEMGRHGIDLKFAGIKEPVPVNADAIQIEQVLINLVQNAIDAIGEEGGKARRLVITLSRGGEGMAEVAVSDTGKGVGKTAALCLFDPFCSTKPQGLGIGLALSRTIIEAHGGRLWLAPRRGRLRGATFRFTLPLYSPRRRRNVSAAPRAPKHHESANG